MSRRAMNRASDRRTTLRVLLGTSLALTGVAHAQTTGARASAATASAPAVDLLADRSVWELDDTARFLGDGALQLAKAAESPEEPQALRRVELPPATAWETELRLSPSAGATAAGLLLVSADYRWVTVMLKPGQRGIQISHGDPLEENKPVDLMRADNLAAWAASGNQVLKVRGDGGKLQAWLNGQDLGYGAPYDFEPDGVGLRSEGGPSQFNGLGWQQVGQDGRLARLSGNVLIPGRPPLMEETFASSALTRAGSLFGGLVGQITGKAPKESSADAWPGNRRDADSDFKRDTTAKLLRLEGLKDDVDADAVIGPTVTYALRSATVAVTARVKLRATPAPHAAAGLFLEDRWRSGKPGDNDGNMLYLNLKKTSMRLDLYNAKKDQWSLLHGYAWPHKDKEVELRLVARGSRAWVFVDRHLVMSKVMDDLTLDAIGGGGLRVDGKGLVEASSFRIDEL